jgi:type IV secretion system protein VirB8
MLNDQSPIQQAKSFETILSLQKKFLAAQAWRICYVFASLSLFLSLIILALILTQEKEIVLIRVDNRTGEAEVLSKVSEEKLTQEEAVEKFFTSRYLMLREQYDYFSLQHDYETVQIFSSSKVRDEYLALFDRSDSPDKVLGEDFNIKVDIVSIAISPATQPYRLASIRFRKKIHDIKNNKTTEKFYTARIVFGFAPEKKIPEKLRLVNPLGFEVVSYQASQELMEN